PNHRQKATARHYTTPFPKCDLAYLCRRQWHAGCVYEQQAIVSRSSGTGRTQNRGRSTPMASSVLWHGTQTEALELLQALSRNCSCVVTAEGVRLSTCAPHEMLSSDQRAIDGLLFARRIASRLRGEEFNPAQSEVGASS